ncbi:Exportin-T [Yarrowia sp. B02]|nr:Exportin-T [Yarrowia sp. B02]
MEDQIEQAVDIAIQGVGDPSVRQQALDFCNQVKASDEGWQMCLAMFAGDRKRSDAARYFSLQVIDEALGRLNREQLVFVRDHLFAYVRMGSGLSQGQADVNVGQAVSFADDPVHMKNKLGETLAYLFIMTYVDIWDTYFYDFERLCEGQGSDFGNSRAVDLYLRVLNDIHREIGDTLIIREPATQSRNNDLKDYIRQRDMARLAESWKSMLMYYKDQTQDPLATEIVNNTLRVIGGWVSWADLTLIAEGEVLEVIFNLLSSPKSRIHACDCLSEIVSKKMNPGAKLQLIQVLNLTSIIHDLSQSDDITFDERVAKLANSIASELIRLAETEAQALGESSEALLLNMFPLLLRYLGNEYDDTSSQVLPAVNSYLQLVRRDSKREKAKINPNRLTKNTADQYENFPADRTFISDQRHAVVRSILEAVMKKCRYLDDQDWVEEEDDEFCELRLRLKNLQDICASIDNQLFLDDVCPVVSQALALPPTANWRDIELGMFELQQMSDSMRSGALSTVKTGQNESPATQAFSNLFFQMVASDAVAQCPQPAVHLLYMEIVVKHSSLFSQQHTHLLNRVLEFFVSPLGIQNSESSKVQLRSWILIHKFCKSVKPQIGQVAQLLLDSIRPLLVVRAEDDADSDDEGSNSYLNAQLNLFELSGMLVSVLDEASATSGVEKTLQPIFTAVEKAIGVSSPNAESITLVHHNLKGIAQFADGLKNGASGTLPDGILQLLKNSAEVVNVALDRIPDNKISEAARVVFNRLVPLLGSSILPEISTLINIMLQGSPNADLPDFLGFLGHLLHQFSNDEGVYSMLKSLLAPLCQRVFASLEEISASADAGNTDDKVLKLELQRQYLAFITQILRDRMGGAIVQDKQLADSIIKSVIHYASDPSDIYTCRSAATCLTKMIQLWGNGVLEGPSETETVFDQGQKIDGFEQLVLEFSGLCWQVPASPGFNLQDAQSKILVTELGNIQKHIYVKKGDQFLSYLVEQYFPQIGVPDNAAKDYVEKLKTLENKEFKKYFSAFVNELVK